MRILKLLFITANIFVRLCFGQDEVQQSFPSTPIENLLEYPQEYNEKSISIVGILDLSHFEDANINGIEIDWSCYDDKYPDSGRLAWERWDTWDKLGIDGKYAEIAGTFVFFEAGTLAFRETYMISKIQYIRIIGENIEKYNSNPFLNMKCNVLRALL